MLVIIDAPHFYAGIIFKGNVAVRAAPILHWTVGKIRKDLFAYFSRKGYKIVVMP